MLPPEDSASNDPPSNCSVNNDNYYDVLFKSSKKPKHLVHAKRVNSQTSIPDHFNHHAHDVGSNVSGGVNGPEPVQINVSNVGGSSSNSNGTSTGTSNPNNHVHPSNISSKRPGDYYIQKLSSSSVHLPRRPISGDSIISLNSNFSDEVSVNSSNFDPHDSRLSSLTSNSIITPNESPSINCYKTDESVNESMSTITSDKARPPVISRPPTTSANSTPNISMMKKKNSITKFDNSSVKSVNSTKHCNPNSKSNNNVISHHEPANSTIGSLPNSSMNSSIDSSINDSISIASSINPNNKPLSMSTSNLSLTRTKTKYLSQEDIKKRQRLRKQQYEDSYNEDEILPNDMDLVFNVPVIKNQNELYMKKNIRHNLVDNDNYKPFPLPGKLKSNSSPTVNQLSVNTSIADSIDELPEADKSKEVMDGHLAESTQTYSQGIIEEENEEEDVDDDDDNEGSIDNNSSGSNENISYYNGNFEDDSQIVNDISNYYTQRSKSYSKFVQAARHDNMMYKLPKYVKSQSSIDDLNLISPEKLMFVDQTRPINLPPKNNTDKAKHNRELHKMVNDFEKMSYSGFGIGDDVNYNDEIHCENEWNDLLKTDNDKFVKRVTNEKNVIRKLNWDSNCPSVDRYDYLMRLLMISINANGSQNLLDQFTDSYNKLNVIYDNLNESMKINRNLEFDKLIDEICTRPFINSIIHNPIFDVNGFKIKVKKLLYLKVLDNNLHKHDEIFLIPMVLILFPNKSLLQQFIMVETLNHEIFNKDLICTIDNNFDSWSSKLSKKTSKFLNNINLKEFENLNLNNFFRILLQFNDKLPLSMSASNPSTPIMNSNYKKSMINSCSIELIFKFLQLLVIYNVNTKTKSINLLKLFQSFLIVIVKYYHINWLDHNELIKNNKSIKLNFNVDNLVNLDSFNDKWKLVFRNI